MASSEDCVVVRASCTEASTEADGWPCPLDHNNAYHLYFGGLPGSTRWAWLSCSPTTRHVAGADLVRIFTDRTRIVAALVHLDELVFTRPFLDVLTVGAVRALQVALQGEHGSSR